jgi:hypothetical protein
VTRIYAEYLDATSLIHGVVAARRWGDVRLEAYTPYPIAAVERALAARPSRLSVAVLAVGLSAAVGAYALQWLLNAYLYPINVGGRPTHFPLSFVPITFEMGVLFASLTAFIMVLIGARMPRLWYPSCDVDGIESATGTAMWLEIAPLAPDADVDALARAITETKPRRMQRLEVL